MMCIVVVPRCVVGMAGAGAAGRATAMRRRRGGGCGSAGAPHRCSSGRGAGRVAGRQHPTVSAGCSARSHPGSDRLHWRSRAGLNNDVHVILFSSQAQVLKWI